MHNTCMNFDPIQGPEKMAHHPDHQSISFSGPEVCQAENIKYKSLKYQGLFVIWTIVLAALSILGNAAHIDLFFGVHIVFGSIFVWLCWMVLGPISGFLSAFCAASYTVYLWGSFAGFPVLILEYLVVAVILRKESDLSRLLVTVVGFYVLVGIPYLFVALTYVLDIPIYTATLVIAKQVLNGVFNASAAVLIFNLVVENPKCRFFKPLTVALRSRLEPSYSGLILSLVILLLLTSVGASNILSIRKSFDNTVSHIQGEVEQFKSRLQDYAVPFLHLKTANWIEVFSHYAHQSEFDRDNIPDFASVESLINKSEPIATYEIFDDGEFTIVHGEASENIALNVRNFIPKIASDGTGRSRLLGCNSDRLVIFVQDTAARKYIVLWPLEILNSLFANYSELKPKIECLNNFHHREYNSPNIIIRDTNIGVPKLQSWLDASIKSNILIGQKEPVSLAMTIYLEKVVRDFHTSFLGYVVISAALVLLAIIIATVLGKKVQFWLYRYAREAENWINTGELNERAITTRFKEDRTTLSWVEKVNRITHEQKNSEILAAKNFNDFVQKAKAPIFATNSVGEICIWNKKLTSLTGYSEKEVVGKRIQDFIDESNMSPNTFDKIFQRESVEFSEDSIELTLLTKTGKNIFLLTGKTFVNDVIVDLQKNGANWPTQHEKRSYFVALDLSASKVANAERIHATRLTALGEMAATFAHELNQPLSSISLSSGNGQAIIQRGNPDLDLLMVKFKRIENQSLRAGEIIRTVRHFILKNDDFEDEEFDPREAVGVALDLTSERLRLSSVQLDVELPPKNLKLAGNKIMFEQSITAILINAQQALRENEAGNRKIWFSCKIQQSCRSCKFQQSCRNSHGLKQYLYISISDNGPGISEELVNILFDPFVTEKSNSAGTGVGLYMARSTVLSLGGNIQAENSSYGATVSFCVPVAEKIS